MSQEALYIYSCSGCMQSGFCDPQRNGTTKGCPCEDCLIKVVCMKPCDLFNDFHISIFGFGHEDYIP